MPCYKDSQLKTICGAVYRPPVSEVVIGEEVLNMYQNMQEASLAGPTTLKPLFPFKLIF
jgi:hypothetical protein